MSGENPRAWRLSPEGRTKGLFLDFLGIIARRNQHSQEVVLTKPAAYLQHYPDNDDITCLLQEKLEGHLKDAGPLSPLMDYVAKTPGKRLRPTLTVLSAALSGEAFGTTVDKHALADIAAAVELIHMASLVHDDIIDDAKERRGMPTAHLLFGLHSAVLAGDYLFTRANKVALRYPKLGIASLFNQAVELTCEGEVMQDETLFDPRVTEKEYLSHICRKTAALIGTACQVGAIMADAPLEAEETLLRFGLELGCAFQIADDVLDFTSDAAISGKEPCNDLRRGLLTLPTILAMKSPLGDIIRKAFRSRSVDDETLSLVKSGLATGGHIQKAKDNAKSLAHSAASRLFLFPSNDAKERLSSIAYSVADRMS